MIRWRDPSTRAPLSVEQLTDLDRKLRQDGDDPAHAVPLALVQLRRQAQVRAALLASPWHTYASLAEVRGASENATRFAVHKAAERRALLVVAHDGVDYARERAHAYASSAKADLKAFPPSEEREVLMLVADFVVDRDR